MTRRNSRRLLLLGLLFSLQVQALPRHEPVPGGIAIVTVADTAVEARFLGRRVMILNENGGRYAVVGIPLSTRPGRHQLLVDDEPIAFTVEEKAYAEQRLTITDD
ncbi:MAG: M23 family peptidase, partial [Pseudomonadales bacterium]